MSKWDAVKIKNEETIINAAIELFIKNGVRNTSIRDIVNNTDLARGTFYNYFKTKEELWQKVVAQRFIILNNEVNSARKEATSPREFIYNAYMSVLTIMNTPPTPALYANNQVSFRQAMIANPELFAVLSDLEKDLRESPFFQGLPNNFYRMTAYAMSGAASEIIVLSYLNNDGFTVKEMAEYLTVLFEKGITTAKY